MDRGTRMREVMSIAAMTSLARGANALQRWSQQRHRRARSLRAMKAMGWVGAGAALGSGLAALFTPYNGRQMRRRLNADARKAGNYIRSRTGAEDRS